jgi:beta-ureidopropionase / N-carbamoyl-L-amino-acid hydrolase
MNNPPIDQARVWDDLMALAAITDPDRPYTRRSFSPRFLEGREWLRRRFEAAGLKVRMDAGANLIGRMEGARQDTRVIMLGSHSDTVPSGGRFDGPAGIIAGLEVVRALQAAGYRPRHAIEIVDFLAEEPSEYGVSCVGSRAMAGALDGKLLAFTGPGGEKLANAVQRVGGDPDKLADARRSDIAGFLELHIEQGAILHEEGIPIGVVEGIVGIRWWEVVVEGVANHAGTTPMNRRRDALLSASELALAVNRVATMLPGRHVATVGQIRAEPGAPNVIPGRVVMSVEIRDLESANIQKVFDAVAAEADRIAALRQTPIRMQEVAVVVAPAPTHERVRQVIAASAKELGLRYRLMPSGAGHDAQDMTHIAPTGMIFVPSALGISHSPKEYTSPEDMANGANVLLRTVLAIDRGALE